MTTDAARGFASLAVHAGQEADAATGAVIPPVHFSTTYAQDGIGGLRQGYEYGRSGNPTRTALQEQLAAIEGGSHAFSFASGLAAEGLRPVVAIYSTFLQRAFDQVVHDAAIQHLPVIFCLDRGGLVGADEGDIAGRPLPNIEDPEQLIARPADRPAPAGLAPIPPAWQPRRGWAGTYDAAWQARRAPYLPLDFDPRFFNVAPPGLVAPGYLAGGEEVEVTGCTAGAALCFRLPRPAIGLEWDFDGCAIAAAPRLDTVLIEPDQGRLQMVWRAELAVDKRLTRLRQVAVRWEPEGEQP